MHLSLIDLHKTTAYITLIRPLNTTVSKGLTAYAKSIKLVHIREVVSFHPKIKFYFNALRSMIASIHKSLSVPYQAHQTCYTKLARYQIRTKLRLTNLNSYDLRLVPMVNTTQCEISTASTQWEILCPLHAVFEVTLKTFAFSVFCSKYSRI
jgi:hypothetical protein